MADKITTLEGFVKRKYILALFVMPKLRNSLSVVSLTMVTVMNR